MFLPAGHRPQKIGKAVEVGDHERIFGCGCNRGSFGHPPAIATSLGSRKAFGNAAAAGLAVTELHPADEKAVEEIMILVQYLFDTK